MRLLISFWEACWYGLIYYMWDIITTWRGTCATCIRFTIYKTTMSYQYMSALWYCKIHLLRFISCYCTLIYTEYDILLCFVMNQHKNLLKLKIKNQLLCFILQHNYSLQSSTSVTFYNIQSKTQSKHFKTRLYKGLPDRCEGYCVYDWGCMDSAILGNTIFQPTSVRDCPEPKHDVNSTVIFDLILRSALVRFILLHVIYYYNLME